MADFSSSFAPFPCSFLANTGGTNILLPDECKQCGCGRRPGCGCKCGKKRRKHH